MGQFADSLKKFEVNTNRKVERVFHRSSLDLLRRLVLRSPVDTGRFRGNWLTGVDNIPAGPVDTTDKVGSTTIGDGEVKISTSKIGQTVFIINNLPYAVPLENGSSQQAPNGMLAITVAEWDGIVKDAIEAEK